jgi:hypothetical protein
LSEGGGGGGAVATGAGRSYTTQPASNGRLAAASTVFIFIDFIIVTFLDAILTL